MGGQSAGNYYRASLGGGPPRRPDTPRPIRRLITSGPTPPQPDEVFAPSKGKRLGVIVAIALGVRRDRRRLRSWTAVFCGGSSWWWWWWSSSQGHGLVDFGSWVRVPPWWVGVDVTARGGKVPGQALFPQLNYPPRLEDRVKTRRGPFILGVCVCASVGPVFK